MKNHMVILKNKLFLICLVIIFSLSFFSGCDQLNSSQNASSKNEIKVEKESTYDRVIKNGKIRVGYVSVPPGCIVDPATGEKTGITVDILREIAKNTGLDIEFTEEVGWGTMIQGLDAGRYDMIGSNTWANPVRGKLATLSKPIYYSGIGIWVRSDDERFNEKDSWSSINTPDTRLGVMDGSTGEVIATTQFPNAKHVTYTDLTGEPQLFLELTANKVDIVFAEPVQGLDYLKSNPGKIKNIAAASPIRIFANVYLMPKKEFQLKGMVDVALESLQNSGFVDQVLKKYEPGPHVYYRVARPFKAD